MTTYYGPLVLHPDDPVWTLDGDEVPAGMLIALGRPVLVQELQVGEEIILLPYADRAYADMEPMLQSEQGE